MARRKPKRTQHTAHQPRRSWLASVDPEKKRRAAGIALRVVLALVVMSCVGVGLAKLDHRVHADEFFEGSPELVLADVPDELEPIIREHLAPALDVAWTEPTLCRRIADRLAESGWVAGVKRVRRLPDGTVTVGCAYRQPFALVQLADGFVLVDETGVRLPGRYPYSPSLPLIQGAAAAPPEPGQVWKAGDVVAGVSVLRMLAREAFADQVTAVLVANYDGRHDPHSAHLELATDRAGGRIVWGSAPGEEIEENTAAQKLAILRRNHELHGRIDAGFPVIDVTTFPDRFTTPSQASSDVVAEHGAA